MKVIGAGFARTGTLSLKAALEQLGFNPCYHMVEVFAHPDHIPIWRAAAEGKPVDLREPLAGYQAAVDWPPSAFYQQLMELYPEAKVILTVRDPERWYESVMNTIYLARKSGGVSPVPVELLEQFWGMIDALIWRGIFSGRFEDKHYAIDLFNQHNERVQREVPAEKLLVFQAQEGWEPLCRFLGVPVPQTPYPHLNDTQSFQERFLGRTVGASH
jgi:hypothetical protein